MRISAERCIWMEWARADEIQQASQPPDSPFVFTTTRGGNLYRGTFRSRFWLPAVERAGLAPLRFHDLRHTCAAFLVSSGAEAKDVQAHLGHASITTTMGTYGHRFESRGRELADRLQSSWETRDIGTDGARLGHAAGSNVVKMRPDLDVS